MAILTYNGQPLNFGLSDQPFYTQPNNWSFISSGEHVWHDLDGHCFYSYGSTNKMFDGTNWSDVTVSGVSSVYGYGIWTDGSNVYYSYGSTQQYYVQYSEGVLTFTPKAWNGFTDFYGSDVWSDGTNIYISYLSDQYVLNKATSTWNSKTWQGYSQPMGMMIWTDGIDFYYNRYVLNKSTSTWTEKTWYGYQNINGQNVWSDGDNTYMSISGGHFMLDPATSTWTQIYPGVNFTGAKVWHNNGISYVSGEYIIVNHDPSQYNFISYETT